MMPRLSLVIALALVTIATPPANAQTVWIGGAVQRDVQRFPQDVAPNRLDGSATGWMAGADVRVWSHLALAIQWSDAGTIEDSRTITVDFGGRTIAITSSFRHHTRAFNALAGYGHMVSSRVQVAYLLGVAVTNVRREFASNAPGLVLVPPSDRTAFASAAVVDRFQRMIGGVDALLRINRRVHAVTGVRAQKLKLMPDASGWSVRTLVGVGWVF
jgi:hypothetical protein